MKFFKTPVASFFDFTLSSFKKHIFIIVLQGPS